MMTQYCQEFIYTGCRGNRNNFKTQRECEQTCGKFRGRENMIWNTVHRFTKIIIDKS